MYKIMLLIFCFALVSCSSFNEENKDDGNCGEWRLVYYNSDSGEPLKGSLTNLIEAVKSGEQIRIVMDQESLTFATEAQYLWVLEDVVYAQNNGEVSVSRSGNKLSFQDDSYYWMFLVNSNGERDMIRWSVGEHDMRGQNKDKVSVKWFIKN